MNTTNEAPPPRLRNKILEAITTFVIVGALMFLLGVQYGRTKSAVDAANARSADTPREQENAMLTAMTINTSPVGVSRGAQVFSETADGDFAAATDPSSPILRCNARSATLLFATDPCAIPLRGATYATGVGEITIARTATEARIELLGTTLARAECDATGAARKVWRLCTQ